MNDLISRQAAIVAINSLHEKPNAWLDSAVDAVMTLPSTDRPQGEWINLDTKLFKVQCSACRVWSDVVGNYCPWCGAYMKGKQDD